MDYFFQRWVSDPPAIPGFLKYLRRVIASSKSSSDAMHIATMYLRVLSVLCERCGLYSEKNIMDTFCFRVTEPQQFRRTDVMLRKYRQTAKHTVNKVIRILKKVLQEEHLDCEISGRYKNIYSIHRKLQNRRYVSALKLRDIFAFRIIIRENDPMRCFDALNILHDHFRPIVDSFKDYVSIPKVNGYQSIHTILDGVLPVLDLPIEVQIRTMAMHEFAEQGLASHWLYARQKKTTLLTEKEQQLASHYRSMVTEGHDMTVHCFSPAGDVIDLPTGSSVLDYAYRIHTDLGDRAAGGIINGKRVPLDRMLREGDRVQVMRAQKKQVNVAWLAFVQTPSARRKIHASL